MESSASTQDPAATPSRVRRVSAPRGSQLTCHSWQTEAILRCLMNNLDPEVAEDPDHLIVYGGTGRAARSWEAFDAIVACLRQLADDQTLLVQSGKPVGILTTHEMAPRVLISNAMLVPEWATPERFRDYEAMGLTMFGQMTAGSWIYIGTQGILQGTFQTFATIAAKRFGGTLAGRIVLTAGLGGMGGAQPLAITMNEGVALCVEVDPHRIERRISEGYLDRLATSVEEAQQLCREAAKRREPLSIGLAGNAAELFPALLEEGFPADVVTDQTSAHDPLNGYIPAGLGLNEAAELRRREPETYIALARKSMASHCGAMISFQGKGAEVFDYGNSLRAEAALGGLEGAFAFPGFVPAYLRPLFCRGLGPFRWVALSGEPDDIRATDRALADLFPENQLLQSWLKLAGERVKFQGLPARICWLGAGERHLAGLRFNEMVASGELKAPVVMGRDHLDSGSVASPYRETEAMMDGSDAIADWPILNALANCASGATWVAAHHGGGVGIGRSIHAGAQIVADGSQLAARKIRLVLQNDPATGVLRHADAGYPDALDTARRENITIPMRAHPARPEKLKARGGPG